MIRLFEAFSGYGSQALALKKYGVKFKHVGISEIDKHAIKAHEALHGKVKNWGDISKINTLSLPDMDLFTYSFPCQDTSTFGKNRGLNEGSNTRSSLLWECKKIIELKRPKYLLLENVKNLVGKKHKHNFLKWLEVLDRLGYNNYWKVVNSKNCGVPHNRERVFCVSILKDKGKGLFKFNKDIKLNLSISDYLGKEYKSCAIRGRNPDNPKSRVPGLPTVQMLEFAKFPNVLNCLTTVKKDAMVFNVESQKERYLTGREALLFMGLKLEEIIKLKDSGLTNNQLYKLAGNSIVVDCMKFLEQLK